VTTTKGPTAPPPTPPPSGCTDKNGQPCQLLRCYHKYALDDIEPALRYCSPGDDVCVISFLKHEDGNHYASQFCSNSSRESWWGGMYHPCTYGDMGGFQCACDFTGCNVDGKTAGFLPMEKRMKMILFHLFLAAMFVLVLFFFCRCCCCRKKSSAHTAPQPLPPAHPQQARRQRKPKASRIVIIILFIILLYVILLFTDGPRSRF